MPIQKFIHPAKNSENDYFDRQKEIDRLWSSIKSGNNIILSGQRRIGKTTILHHFLDNLPRKYVGVFIDVEGVANEEEYYNRLNEALYKSDALKFTNFITRILQPESPATSHHYNLKTEQILKSIKEDIFVVIIIDEFSQAVENIYKNKGKNKAVRLLQSNRELRQNPNLQRVFFIYSGSISVANIARKLDATHLINDMYVSRVRPFLKNEAITFLKALIKKAGLKIESDQLHFLVTEIGWLSPYVIFQSVKAIVEVCLEENYLKITQNVIQKAMKRMVEGQLFIFDTFKMQLKHYFSTQSEYDFAKQILNLITKNSMLSSNEVAKIASEQELNVSYKEIMRPLIDDGYLEFNTKKNEYMFVSPLFQKWWSYNAQNEQLIK